MVSRKSYPDTVAAAVHAAISNAGSNPGAVARGSGIPRVTLVRRLAGSPFTVDELDRIAAFLKVPVRDLAAPEPTGRRRTA